ncbi:MAG: gliding motility-associated C-terminal domain-containing protein [Flavobacteriales bacterium]|nr:gliding motility-associated C-terminal domain-containing protein [Flavobacteriales bacterium]
MKLRLILVWLLGLMTIQSFATHNRAGEITYEFVSGSTYKIIVTTYTKESSCAADRCELVIDFGDGTQDTVARNNGTSASGTCPPCGCQHCGELIGDDIKKNVYSVNHAFPGPSKYIISVEDPYRNDNINNIPNSLGVAFFISSELVIAPNFLNESPVLTNPPVDNGCVNILYSHNPGAYDPDGDSLVYSLVPSIGAGGAAIQNYVFPHQVAGCTGGTFTIDSKTGTLTWDAPVCQGEYNVAILIEEFRNGTRIGSIRRDMQITINAPCLNLPPMINELSLKCVFAGDTINESISASDPNPGELLTLTATGEPLFLSNSPASFDTISGFSSISGSFEWITNCDHVREADYQTIFKVSDNNNNVSLSDFETFQIRVISPAPENLHSGPQGNSILLTWDQAYCPNIDAYKIYRRIDSLGFSPDSCETGAPAGYFLLTTVPAGATSYLDNNDLIYGQKYCYLIVACFANGAESQASFETCSSLKKEVPIITHVSIHETNQQSGKDSIIWSMPTELDTIQYPGPYKYKVLRKQGFDGADVEIYQTGLKNSIVELDTILEDIDINTSEFAWNYKIEFYYNSNELVGASNEASSVFLSSTPTDNALELNWSEDVPWTNSEYVIYKNLAGAFIAIDTVSASYYTDYDLVNGEEYCYYVKSIGSYSVSGIINPILNRSQIHCGIPVDNIAPCPPDSISILANCFDSESSVIWNNPISIGCADDVVGYNVFFTPIFGGDFNLLGYIPQAEDTFYFHESESIAGCYAVAALDTFLNQSVLSDTVCIDNCPVYELPNVFTPGADGFNDELRPFPYRHVESVDLRIYNRWGERVFKTLDPNILWNGEHEKSGLQVSDGIYYYVCDVFEIRLRGLEKRTIKGYFHVLSN